MTDAETWERRYLLEAQKYARLLLSVTERELELFEERVAREADAEAKAEAGRSIVALAREALAK